MYEELYMLLLIGLNLLVCYIYSDNRLFPILFILFEIFYGMSIIAESAVWISFLMLFGIMYNVLLEKQKRSEH